MISQEFRHCVLGYRQLYMIALIKTKSCLIIRSIFKSIIAPVPVYGTLGMGKALFFRKHQTGTSYINR